MENNWGSFSWTGVYDTDNSDGWLKFKFTEVWNETQDGILVVDSYARDYDYKLVPLYESDSDNVSTFSGLNGFERRYDDINGEHILSWTSIEDPNTTIEIARGSVNFYSSEQTVTLDNGSLVAIWSEYNSGVFASIIDPSTADLTVIDLTASLNLSTADAWNYSIHPTDDGIVCEN